MTRNEVKTMDIAITTPAKTEIERMINSHPKLAASTKNQYRKAISGYLNTGNSLADIEALSAYAATLSKSSKSFLKAGVKLWTKYIEIQTKSNSTPEIVNVVTATLHRLDAINEAIQVEATKGQKAHTWLSQAEVKKLLATCNTKTVKGKRDKIILGLLVGAGLRREEVINLTFEDILIQPVKGKFRTVLNVKGKGAKDRAIPIRDSLAKALTEWQNIVKSGYVARSITKGDTVGDSLSAIGVFHIVRNAGEAIGKDKLAPHDLRRTFAQLGYEAGISITQISKLLGHSNVATTQRYLNLDLDLETTVSDFVPFE
jgi:site-specific recombinase XerD